MQIHCLPAAVLGTNCYVLAAADQHHAIVVDPGVEIMPALERLLANQSLTPQAVVLTHGHLDHTASCAQVSQQWDTPVWIHADDAYLLNNPLLALSDEVQIMLGVRQITWQRPQRVQTFSHGQRLEVGGLQVEVAHAPGHTPGSALLLVHRADADDQAPVCLSGDVLFNGSIGRTDLPGGDHAAMQRSLAEHVLTLPEDTVVYPGHGPQTTIGMERMVNTYLRQVAGLPLYEPEV